MGVVFDFYRSFRSWQNWGRIFTFIGDLLFSLIAMAILFIFFEKANALDFRLYIVWGSLLGLVLYLKLLSRFSLRFFFGLYKFLSFLTNLIYRGVKIPVRGLILIMRPPYALLRWFSLLLFRITEVTLFERIMRIERRLREWWKELLPPRTNG